MSTDSPAALGFRAHSGWAALVAASGTLDSPVVILRRRVELARPGMPGAVQPYHAAREMTIEKARAHIERCAEASADLAERAVRQATADLERAGYRTIGAAVLLASGRPAGDLAATLASHAAIHTAEGEFFRNALRRGCQSCNLPAEGIRERDLTDRSAAAFGISIDEVLERVALAGKSIGPPWRQDEKLAALAAWLVLRGAASAKTGHVPGARG